MHKTKIDWADATWNPITGCKHGCSYCYAEKLTKRFSSDIRLNMSQVEHYSQEGSCGYVLEKPFPTRNGRSLAYPFGFAPTLHRYRLGDLDKWKNGVNIFVCSMADLFGAWVPDEWISEIFEECKKYPQHNYLFLTKNPTRYEILEEKGLLPKGENFWYGSTVTSEAQSKYFCSTEYNCFLSIEPLLEDIAGFDIEQVDWVIIGAQSGKGKDVVKPEKEWVENIACYCKIREIPVFMKGSMEELMGNQFVAQMPPTLRTKKPSVKHSANCMECGANNRKSEMTYILTREGKGRGAKSVGSICTDCMGDMLQKWGKDGEEHGNDEPREPEEDVSEGAV